MVQPQAAARFGLPLSLFTYEPALTTQLNQVLYQVTASGAQPSATGHAVAPGTSALTFHYADKGLDVVKTFRFDSGYVLTVETEVKRNGVPVRALVEWPAGLGDMEEFLPASLTRSSVPTPSQFAWSLDGKQDSIAAKKVSGNATIDQPYEYAAIIDLYFAAAFLPDAPQRTSVVTLHNTIDLPSDLSDPNSQKRPTDVLGLAVGDQSGSTCLPCWPCPPRPGAVRKRPATRSFLFVRPALQEEPSRRPHPAADRPDRSGAHRQRSSRGDRGQRHGRHYATHRKLIFRGSEKPIPQALTLQGLLLAVPAIAEAVENGRSRGPLGSGWRTVRRSPAWRWPTRGWGWPTAWPRPWASIAACRTAWPAPRAAVGVAGESRGAAGRIGQAGPPSVRRPARQRRCPDGRYPHREDRGPLPPRGRAAAAGRRGRPPRSDPRAGEKLAGPKHEWKFPRRVGCGIDPPPGEVAFILSAGLTPAVQQGWPSIKSAGAR